MPVVQEFGLPRAVVNQGLSLFMIGGAVWSPIAGRVLDRYPAPVVMATGGLLMASDAAVLASKIPYRLAGEGRSG